MKKLILSVLVSFSTLFTITTLAAENEGVEYHCPSVQEASETFGIHTDYNDKRITWKIESKLLSLDEKPEEFMKVILKKENIDSYDMKVSCIYRSNKNREFIIIPIESWHWHVKGVAEKTLGNKWSYDELKQNVECNKSIQECGYVLG